MTAPLLEIRDLRTCIAAGDRVIRAVDGISLALNRGETFALLGESGSGKSLTALSVMRLLPDAGRVVGGEVRLEGKDLLALPERAMRDVRGRRIGMIFQEPGASLDPVMTVGDQVREVLDRHLGLRGSAADRRVLELFEAVGIPDPRRRMDEYPFQLSGGLKQRVMIAGALACEPELLIADEPTTALDVTIQAQVLGLLRDLQKRTGMAVLLITHDLGVVAEMAHRVAVMYAGELVETAPRERLFTAPAHPYTRKLFASVPGRHLRDAPLAAIGGQVPALWREFSGCRFVERCDHAFEACSNSQPAILQLEGGQAARCHLHDPRFAGRAARAATTVSAPLAAAREPMVAAPLLEVRDLAVHFPICRGVLKRVVGQVRAVDGLSLDLHAGRTLALVGESGCGKTTAGKAMVRLLEPTRGRVLLRGEDLTALGGAALRTRRRDFQIIFQDPFASLNPRMRLAEIVSEGMLALGVGGDAAARDRRVDELLEQVGLSTDMRHRYPHELSGGQRQRIAIARALAVEPKVIVCDEPTSALDVSVQAQILNLLRELQQRLGVAYLFITHNLSVVEFLAHEVAVMYLGRIVEHGGVGQVLESPRHPYTQALLAAVPRFDGQGERLRLRAEGDLPSPANPPAGCHFHPRCAHAQPTCRESYPSTVNVAPGHSVRCVLTGPAAS
ncbi:MAG: dipeptide ABC transporter ATP-binding protein [Betaproteobacteria bacterium]|jgi:peptide/nickel transport system ATP-binding protein|nr:dipeptide ABC transporter ATP-binding protein [Rhodocyclaceae bacterium]MCA3133626.1 dipeptide ABC transporter ATP-binding protein [Rhodocyclaceae bacterium]MCA3142947.1 dipeptide ABC transporter ATP-binding protein [Rhodocyclaceae bacterium]MCA3144054.1 dipeptide ABC transporter ATP-binding protein [Rhodocyclaceae bacterium]MCE2898273.1 dipeptide ABC transporter ATP-binding protein [Betaproteobacteria bacterium]